MLFVCDPQILHKHCFQFLLGVKMAPKETKKKNAYAKFWVHNKEHYGMLRYFFGVVNIVPERLAERVW